MHSNTCFWLKVVSQVRRLYIGELLMKIHEEIHEEMRELSDNESMVLPGVGTQTSTIKIARAGT